MSRTNSSPIPLHLPETTLYGSGEEYLNSIEPSFRQPVATMVLRLIAAERLSSTEDGDALKCLARMERAVSAYITNSAPVKNVPWGQLTETKLP